MLLTTPKTNVLVIPTVNITVPRRPFFHASSQYKLNSSVRVSDEASRSIVIGCYEQALAIESHFTHFVGYPVSGVSHRNTGSCAKKGSITNKAPIIEY